MYTFLLRSFIGKEMFQLTGTKNLRFAKNVIFKGNYREPGYQDGWMVQDASDGQRYTLTIQPHCLITKEGIDCFNGERAADWVIALIQAEPTAQPIVDGKAQPVPMEFD